MNIRPMTSKDKSAVMRILQNTPEFTPAEVVLADEVISDYLFNPQDPAILFWWPKSIHRSPDMFVTGPLLSPKAPGTCTG